MLDKGFYAKSPLVAWTRVKSMCVLCAFWGDECVSPAPLAKQLSPDVHVRTHNKYTILYGMNWIHKEEGSHLWSWHVMMVCWDASSPLLQKESSVMKTHHSHVKKGDGCLHLTQQRPRKICVWMIEEHIIQYMSILVLNSIAHTQIYQRECICKVNVSSKLFEHLPNVEIQKLHQNLRSLWCPYHVELHVHHDTQRIGKRNW
jgi:hypothetical protein